ncbi:MAG: DUF4145 domain-containing protein [Candidatus Aminicenantes bacterium]|nr:DUF4145 domain-containing protein [Candidatus Aminicenantes bacterium]
MDINVKHSWKAIVGLSSRGYTCGYCNRPLASEKGWHSNNSGFIYVCHHCTRPTFFDFHGEQIPGVMHGNPVGDITDKSVSALYDEARSTTQANAYTATVLCCRKLLMHVAVSKGAKLGESFAFYVTYLAEKNFVPPDAMGWIDHIRKKGNEANHEITIMKKDDAEELLSFTEMLLRIIYEFPAMVAKKYQQGQQGKGKTT